MSIHYSAPDAQGHFGQFGGRFVPEALISALDQLEREYIAARDDISFQQELADLHETYTGRPSPLTFAKRFSDLCGVKVFLKREDLNHTGSHKINNVLGQALLTKRMG
ncbi:MAG: Tryptophan synthase beta chain, partial [Actinomycetota bacterium]